MTYTISTHSAAETFSLGQHLGTLLQSGQVVALQGDLGAGKTVLSQGIAYGLGITARVTSPTFTLVSEYTRPDGDFLIHIDCYRLGSPTQADGALEAVFFGLEEIVDRNDAVVLIEWAERVATLLPPDHLQIILHADPAAPDQRQIQFIAHGPQSATIVESVKAGE